MDFGRGVKKRARMMDKKLDQIVANPYEGQVKRSHKSIKKPLFISFGAAAACLCVVFASIGIVKVIDNMSSNRGSGIIIDPDYKPEDKDKTKPGYKGTVPKIDLKNYVSNNFGYPEFSYFSFFANNVSMPRMAVRGTDLKDIGETKEYTTNQPINSYTDEDGKIHTPLPILSTYSFSGFLYFEFDNSNSSFLADRIGNGHIQALCVHTNVYDEDVLVLKNGNKFYSCLGNGITNGSDGKVLELSFTTSKYIEGWDIVKDSNQTTEFTIYFKKGKGFEGASAIEIDNSSFDINYNSVYFLDYSFDISVNKVRAFLRLDADPRFNVTEAESTSKVQEIYYRDKTTFRLVEHGSETFDFQGLNSSKEPVYKFGDIEFALIGYSKNSSRPDSYFVADINGDGYRDFVYFGYKEEARDYVIVYDLHNNTFIEENVSYRVLSLGFTIKNGSLLVYSRLFASNGICDYADIVWNKDNTISLNWHNINKITSLTLVKITDQDGNEITPISTSPNHYTYDSNVCPIYHFDVQTEDGRKLPGIILDYGLAAIEPSNNRVHLLGCDHEEDVYYHVQPGFGAIGTIDIYFEMCGFRTELIRVTVYSTDD